jgi:hypothetical protein
MYDDVVRERMCAVDEGNNDSEYDEGSLNEIEEGNGEGDCQVEREAAQRGFGVGRQVNQDVISRLSTLKFPAKMSRLCKPMV